MKLLLDTHSFLWLLSAPSKMSKRALDVCKDPENLLVLSVASAWEIEIKQQLGKLEMDVALEDAILEQESTNALRILPVQLRHTLALRELPQHHSDPFDRILIAQARTEGLHLVTSDQKIQQYTVDICW